MRHSFQANRYQFHRGNCDGLDTQMVIDDERMILLRLFCDYTKAKKTKKKEKEF